MSSGIRADFFIGDEIRDILQISRFLRRGDVIAEAAADQGDVTAGGLAGRDDAGDTRDVAGKTGDRDAAGQIRDQGFQTFLDLGFGAGMPLHRGIRGIRNDREHARISPPRALSAASSATAPTTGSGSNFQSPVCSTVP